MGEKDEKPIRVVDRRMFTPDGELRPGFEPEENAPSPPPPPTPAPARTPPPPTRPAGAPQASASERPAPAAEPPGFDPSGGDAKSSSAAAADPLEATDEPGAAGAEGGLEAEGGEPGAEPRSEFTAIIRSLATTAYSALGLLPDPTGARHREPAVARQMIDWLAVLESKTRNNLSFEESDFLSRVLYELRLAFVEVMGPPPGPGAGHTRPPGR